MSQCPNCQADISDDFGLVTCEACGASLFVEMDGSIVANSDIPENAQMDQVEEPVQDVEALQEEQWVEEIPSEELSYEESPEDENYESPMADVLEYANSEASQGREGPLVYRLVISGIDSAELRKELKESLTDRRLSWDADELMKEIVQGRLVIEGLSAVKTYVVVNRLAYLPLQIEWEQAIY
ncbi:MAG: zinc ribbon domain-containing protein [Bdellovibrionales bacterium]|nr:zinc ribbon domain-containing protein [Bdellovibrionales bacterium]